MIQAISAATVVAGVAGSPIRHSLSPLIHNAWIAGAGLDAVYVAFAPGLQHFGVFARGLRGGVIRGLNITAPFKEEALAVADQASARALAAGSANLLLFAPDGVITADNTDGVGLLHAFGAQAPDFDPAAGPLVILGAGGAARGAAATFLAAGAPCVTFINRTAARGEALAGGFGPRAASVSPREAAPVLAGAQAVINATPLGLQGGPALPAMVDLALLSSRCVVMDMVYRPVRTALLAAAALRGLRTVDGLEMLIGQAKPSFEAFFGQSPPKIDVRALARAALGDPE